MRPLVDWFGSADDEIVHFLYDYKELDLPPKVISHNLNKRYEISLTHVKHRLRALDGAGMVESLEDTHGYYRITGLGIKYAEGEMGAEELDALDPNGDT